MLSNEDIEFNAPYSYSLEKIYVCVPYKFDGKPGDFLLIYRMGNIGTSKAYSSVITGVGIINEVKIIDNFDKLQDICKQKCVLTREELEINFTSGNCKALVIKLIYYKAFKKKIILHKLWDNDIIQPYGGPRLSDKATKEQFETIKRLGGGFKDEKE